MASSDVVMTTTAVRWAPPLTSAAMARPMRLGPAVVGLAAPSGGNCELTSSGEARYDGLSIVPGAGLAASMPAQAPALYARNVANFVLQLVKDASLHQAFATKWWARASLWCEARPTMPRPVPSWRLPRDQ